MKYILVIITALALLSTASAATRAADCCKNDKGCCGDCCKK